MFFLRAIDNCYRSTSHVRRCLQELPKYTYFMQLISFVTFYRQRVDIDFCISRLKLSFAQNLQLLGCVSHVQGKNQTGSIQYSAEACNWILVAWSVQFYAYGVCLWFCMINLVDVTY